jgi:acyl carrier protein
MNDIEKRLLSVIGTIKGSEGSAINLDAELRMFVRDSFDVFELQLDLEEAFGTEIDNERFIEAKTIRDLLGLVSG